MTLNEFFSEIKKRNGQFFAPVSASKISLTNASLQQHRRAILPHFLIELYGKTGGIALGSGYIFGPNEIIRPNTFPTPDIIRVNNDLSSNEHIVGKTIFGRNDLFWFAFDAFGTCYMLDNLSLRPLRKYEDPIKAMFDCLIIGKV